MFSPLEKHKEFSQVLTFPLNAYWLPIMDADAFFALRDVFIWMVSFRRPKGFCTDSANPNNDFSQSFTSLQASF